MKISATALVICAWLWSIVVPSEAQLRPLCGYTGAQSTFQDLRLSANYRYFQDQYKKVQYNDGAVTLSFSRIHDAPSQGASVESSATLLLDHGIPSYQTNGAANMRSYWGQSDAFGYWGIDGETVPTAKGVGWAAKALAGLGYGRFRDVTPYSKALRIQTRLIEMKSLLQPLAPEGLQALAELIDRRSEFPDQAALVQKLAELIEQSGQLQKKPLGALELLRIEEILNEKADSKLCGWDVSLGAGYELLDPSGGPRDLFFHASFDYALAPAPRSQFRSKIKFDSQLKILEEHTLWAMADYSYRWGDIVDMQLKYVFTRNKLRGKSATELQNLDLRLNLQAQTNPSFVVQWSLAYGTGYEAWSQMWTLMWNYDFF